MAYQFNPLTGNLDLVGSGGGGNPFDQDLNTNNDVVFDGIALGTPPYTKKLIVDSNSGGYGQLQLINPDPSEVTIVFASAGSPNGEGAITSDSGDTIWAFGLGSYGGSPNNFYFGNNGVGGHVVSISPTGDLTAAGAVKGQITTDSPFTTGSVSPNGYLTLYDSNGTAYKVPAQAL
jgi:hypothetical protein